MWELAQVEYEFSLDCTLASVLMSSELSYLSVQWDVSVAELEFNLWTHIAHVSIEV